MSKSKQLRARDFMIDKPVTFSPDMPVMDAAQILAERRVSGAPVIDDQGNLVGILTERDCLRTVLSASYHSEPGGRVDEYMSHDVEVVDTNESLMDIATRFVETKYRRFPVMEKNRVVGLICRRDTLKAVLDLS